MKITRILLLVLLVDVFAVCINGQTPNQPNTVVVLSGSLRLHALLWRPKGNGPFPAVLFNHGRGLTPQTEGRVESITELGRVFADHGYVFLALFRRGEDLSVGKGIFIGDLLDSERATKGAEAAQKLQLRLLETDQLEDALAGLAFLRKLPEVDRRRVAAIGHSFGGSLTLLIAERNKSLRAAISFAGAAEGWANSVDLRDRLKGAAGRLDVPVLFVYAANDFSVAPGKELAAEMTRLSKPNQLKLFPPFGKTAKEGHRFVYLGIPIWERDVFAFLDSRMKRHARSSKRTLGRG